MKWERKTGSSLMRGISQRSEAVIFPLCFRSRWQQLSSRCDISAAPNTLIRQPSLPTLQNILSPLCDLKASSETQYFPGGPSSSHPPHTTTCFKDPGPAERMWQESDMDFPHLFATAASVLTDALLNRTMRSVVISFLVFFLTQKQCQNASHQATAGQPSPPLCWGLNLCKRDTKQPCRKALRQSDMCNGHTSSALTRSTPH